MTAWVAPAALVVLELFVDCGHAMTRQIRDGRVGADAVGPVAVVAGGRECGAASAIAARHQLARCDGPRDQSTRVDPPRATSGSVRWQPANQPRDRWRSTDRARPHPAEPKATRQNRPPPKRETARPSRRSSARSADRTGASELRWSSHLHRKRGHGGALQKQKLRERIAVVRNGQRHDQQHPDTKAVERRRQAARRTDRERERERRNGATDCGATRSACQSTTARKRQERNHQSPRQLTQIACGASAGSV